MTFRRGATTLTTAIPLALIFWQQSRRNTNSTTFGNATENRCAAGVIDEVQHV
jgi:hypothetical protein